MSRINVHNVGNPYTMVIVTPAVCLRGVPTSPLKESIVVKEFLLIDDLEGYAMVLRGARPPNLKWIAH